MRFMAPAPTETATTIPPAPAAKLGLRERKKLQTSQAIRHTAYRLFEEQGYDGTPVDQIAEEAEVSPSTVFRYFPTKEDIVLTDEYDPMIEEALRARPVNETPVVALRETLNESLARLFDTDIAETWQRIRLIREVPALRARMSEQSGQTCRVLARALAERADRPVDDLEVRIVTGAMLGALTEALFSWIDDGGDKTLTDLERLVARALNVLERGLTL